MISACFSSLQDADTGALLLEKVWNHLDLFERDYFGIRFLNTANKTSVSHAAMCDNKIISHTNPSGQQGYVKLQIGPANNQNRVRQLASPREVLIGKMFVIQSAESISISCFIKHSCLKMKGTQSQVSNCKPNQFCEVL